MQNFIIVVASLAILVIILYLVDFKLEFRYSKEKDTGSEPDKSILEKLSNAEVRILKQVSEGRSNQDIADNLYVSVHTVKKHVSNILKKLGLTSRTELRKFKDLFS